MVAKSQLLIYARISLPLDFLRKLGTRSTQHPWCKEEKGGRGRKEVKDWVSVRQVTVRIAVKYVISPAGVVRIL